MVFRFFSNHLLINNEEQSPDWQTVVVMWLLKNVKVLEFYSSMSFCSIYSEIFSRISYVCVVFNLYACWNEQTFVTGRFWCTLSLFDEFSSLLDFRGNSVAKSWLRDWPQISRSWFVISPKSQGSVFYCFASSASEIFCLT